MVVLHKPEEQTASSVLSWTGFLPVALFNSGIELCYHKMAADGVQSTLLVAVLEALLPWQCS